MQGHSRVDDLRPCPFCGSPAHMEGIRATGYFVACDNVTCYAELGSLWSDEGRAAHCFGAEGDARIAWNRRAYVQAPAIGAQEGR